MRKKETESLNRKLQTLRELWLKFPDRRAEIEAQAQTLKSQSKKKKTPRFYRKRAL